MGVTIFPDATALTIAYLADTLPQALADCAVGAQVVVASLVPRPRPPLFVRVQPTGGSLRDAAHERQMMAVQCWNEAGEVPASDLARMVCALLRAWPLSIERGREVTSVSASSPYFFPDPNTDTPRYQITCEVVCRAERTSQ